MKFVLAGIVGVAALALAGAAVAAPMTPTTPATPFVVAASPTPDGAGASGPGDVSCPSEGFCVQVGTLVHFGENSFDNRGLPLAVVREGTRTTTQQLPLPDDAAQPQTNAPLTAVDCVGARYCVAIGTYDATAHESSGYAETYSDGVWQATALPYPATSYGIHLSRLACNATSCVATGQSFDGFAEEPYLAVRDSKGTWTAPAINTTADFYEVTSPVCPPSGTCRAQGYVFPGQGSTLQRAQFLFPTADGWKPVNFPIPAGADKHTLVVGTMACPSAEFCTALATYRDESTHENGLAVEQFVSGRLRVRTIPIPAADATAKGYLLPTRTSCGSVASGVGCAAAARFHGKDAYSALVRFTGGRWQVQPAPAPSGALPGSVQLDDVSCAASGACAAVGVFRTAAGTVAMSERTYPDGIWTAARMRVDAGMDPHAVSVDAVSCAGVQCAASASLSGFATRARPRHLLYASTS